MFSFPGWAKTEDPNLGLSQEFWDDCHLCESIWQYKQVSTVHVGRKGWGICTLGCMLHVGISGLLQSDYLIEQCSLINQVSSATLSVSYLQHLSSPGKILCKTSFQIGMDLRKVQRQGRYERTQKEYPTSAKVQSMRRCRVVFLHFFHLCLVSALFRSIPTWNEV